jgi:hypothetical protein
MRLAPDEMRRYDVPRQPGRGFSDWWSPVFRPHALSLVALLMPLAGCEDFGDPARPDGGQEPETGQVTILPVRDNTLYETAQGEVSNGAGSHMFAGLTGPNAGRVLRRGVLSFDVAAVVPAGATIDSVSLGLHLSNSSTGGGASSVALHRLLADWGEGVSNAGEPGGSGAAAASGDATWQHRFFDTDSWSSAGGDFLAAASASTVVGEFAAPDDPSNSYEWAGAGLVEDVQSMLDDPAGNFGWILVGDEATSNSSKRFHTKEHGTPEQRPRLFIRYRLPIPAPSPDAPRSASGRAAPSGAASRS